MNLARSARSVQRQQGQDETHSMVLAPSARAARSASWTTSFLTPVRRGYTNCQSNVPDTSPLDSVNLNNSHLSLHRVLVTEEELELIRRARLRNLHMNDLMQ